MVDWTHDRLKAHAWDPAKHHVPQWAQAKENGWRVTFFVQEGRRCVAYGRDDSPHRELTRLYPSLRPYAEHLVAHTAPHTSVDCEVIPAGGGSNSGVVAALKSGQLELRVFAIPWLAGANLSRERDLASLRSDTLGRIHGLSLPLPHPVKWVEQRKVFLAVGIDYRQYFLSEAEEHGLEGFVLKDGNYFGWYKLKRERTVDVVVVSMIPGKGRLAGVPGSLGVSVYRADGSARFLGYVSGFTDQERAEIDPSWVGTVIEVKYQDVGARGNLQKPRYLRRRPDKPAAECTETQLPETCA